MRRQLSSWGKHIIRNYGEGKGKEWEEKPLWNMISVPSAEIKPLEKLVLKEEGFLGQNGSRQEIPAVMLNKGTSSDED